jgi:hypothetical protein
MATLQNKNTIVRHLFSSGICYYLYLLISYDHHSCGVSPRYSFYTSFYLGQLFYNGLEKNIKPFINIAFCSTLEIKVLVRLLPLIPGKLNYL